MSAAAGVVGAAGASDTASASVDVSSGDGYEIWRISGKETYDLSDGEELSNILVDQTESGACLTIRARNKSGWSVRNVGFMGVGREGDGGNRFQFQVSAPSGGHGLIENVWANGKRRDGQRASELGGIYIRSSHAGHIDIRHTYIEGFGNNAVYGSAVGKDGGNDGSVAMENCYHRDNTVSQFRIGSPDSIVRNSVGIVDDPDGDRGVYPGTSSNRNARGLWGKHFRNQCLENCSLYISPDDNQPDGVFEARYINDRSHGPEAVAEIIDCHVNADAPTMSGTTSNARVNFTNLGESPTVNVIQDGGVPTSPEMAARGEREMPPELPGASGGSGSDGSNDDETDDSTTLDRTLTVDGTDAGWTDYEFTVSGDLAENADAGSIGVGDSIDGSTGSGFVNGGTDGYRFSGEVTDITVDGDAAIIVDGTEVDPSDFGSTDDPGPTVSTEAASAVAEASATLNGTLDDLGGAESADVAFEWREADTSTWTRTDAETLSSTEAFSREVTGLTAATTYEYRAVADASDGDDGAGSTVELSTESADQLDRTLTVDGTDAGWTDYQFTVSGDLAENADAGSIGVGDSIDGSTGSGFVNGGTDGYRFSGEVTDITVDGDAAIIVDGTEVDPADLGGDEGDGSTDLPHTLTFDGSSGGQTSYEVAVSGDLAANEAVGGLEDDDVIDGNVATGVVDGDVDGYQFSGEIVGIQVDGDAVVLVDGEQVDPASLILPNHLAFEAGDGQGETTYEFQVSGDLVSDPLLGSAESGDVVDGGAATGAVADGDRDGFRFSGDLVSLRLDGEASVIFEDTDG